MLPARWITDWEPSARFPLYTRANAGEVLPEPASPLGWTLVWEQGVIPGWRDAMVRFGVTEPDELDPGRPEVVGSFGGYLYIDLSVARLLGVRGPGLTPDTVDAMYFGPHEDVAPYAPRPGDECPAATERLARSLAWVLGTTALPELEPDRHEADQVRSRRPDLMRLTDGELVDRARSLVPLVRHLFERHLTVTAGSSVGPGELAAIADRVGDPTLLVRLLSGIGAVASAAPSLAMWDLSRLVAASADLSGAFDAGVDGLLGRVAVQATPESGAFLSAFDAFLERYGSRGPNEWDIRSRTWETRPELALSAVDRMRLTFDQESPRARHDRLVVEREDATDQVRRALAEDGTARERFEAALCSSHAFIVGRERTKTTIVKVVHEIRMAVWELGLRAHRAGFLAHPQQVCMLLADELEEFVAGPDALGSTLADRERVYLRLFDLDPPFLLDGVVPPLPAWPPRATGTGALLDAGGVLAGSPGCAGTATGRAKVVADPSDPSALEPGDVLVAPSTDPSWTPLFVSASAVVVDVGALVSHAVIISRELGIPCVVGVTGATRRVPDGALVRVDGAAGTVTVLET